MTIDVIVPVYRGDAATRRCIESVLRSAGSAGSSTQKTPFELIVVNDGCPEPELVRWLRELAEISRLTLVEQPQRQGFAAAVNRAIALHPERDVVILHSDAEVANDWLDRLVAPASAARDIGTVVPFSNSGGIAAYPRTNGRNAMPAEQTLKSLDLLFRRANAGSSVMIPLGCGPCVFLRRACLDAVGPFDSGPLGSDYGVEQDFCLRASGAGFRHALAADVYIWHWGETSFGSADAQNLSARAEKALGKLYPHYPAQRAEFSARDPARPFQRQVDLLRLAESPRQLLLFIAHGWGGGIRRHMDDLAEMVAERCDVLLLQPGDGDTVKLSWPKEGEGFTAYFALPADLPALVSLLRWLGLVRVHFHHIHGLPSAVLDLPGRVGVPYDCTLHDYYAICPQYHLDAEDGRYCGEPDALGCAACLTKRPGQWGMDITAWRGALGQLLRGADRVFAPSRDVAQRIGRYFPDVDAVVMPHPEGLHTEPGRITRVVTLGNLSPEKGLRVVAACASDARTRRLPLSFRVLGATTEPVPQWPDAPLSIHGQYADEGLATLIAAERPDVIWFPAQVPETYSYTLSVALAAGAAIVVSALGALVERAAGHPRAMVVRWDATPAEWNEALLKAGALGSAARPALSRVAVK
jgi:GT2 family glycosyltransferase/glycosyltransferase involved in cell wall biosynthesis